MPEMSIWESLQGVYGNGYETPVKMRLSMTPFAWGATGVHQEPYRFSKGALHSGTGNEWEHSAKHKIDYFFFNFMFKRNKRKSEWLTALKIDYFFFKCGVIHSMGQTGGKKLIIFSGCRG